MAWEFLERFGIEPAQNHCADPWGYAAFMLTQVSRTFALNINILGRSCRRPVLLAYLYMRIADTVEDDPAMSSAEKQHLLDLFARAFEPESVFPQTIRAFQDALPESWHHSQDPYHFLCRHSEWVVELLSDFGKNTVQAVGAGVREMCEGMALFTQRQEQRRADWFVLESFEDLDRYCYYVAGLVGNMLCDIFQAQSLWITRSRYRQMKNYSVSFGLGLQMVNIIKDIAEDSERKVCFIPEALCRKHGIAVSPDLFSRPVGDPARTAVVAELVDKAWHHLEDAIRYTLLIPVTEPRIRLFCLWPLFMAAETLCAVEQGEKLFDPTQKVKISRTDVQRIVRDTTWHFYSSRWIWSRFHQLRHRSPTHG